MGKTAGALGKISAVASNCILYHHIFIVNKKVLFTVFDEAVKVTEKNLDPELFFFFFQEALLYAEVWWLSQRKVLVQLFELWTEVMEYHFHLKQWFINVILTWAFDRCFLKWTKQALYIKEKNWQFLLLVIKSEISSEKQNFGKLPGNVSLTVSR